MKSMGGLAGRNAILGRRSVEQMRDCSSSVETPIDKRVVLRSLKLESGSCATQRIWKQAVQAAGTADPYQCTHLLSQGQPTNKSGIGASGGESGMPGSE